MNRLRPPNGRGKCSAPWTIFSSSRRGHPLAETTQPLTNKQLSLHRAVVISDSARYCHPLNSNLLDEQPQVRVDDFASKVELLRAGLGCGFTAPYCPAVAGKGELVEKPSSPVA